MTPGARVLITGASGFSGRWLIAHLRATKQVQLAGLTRAADPPLDLDDRVECDLCDRQALAEAVARVQPEFVFHLAGRNSFSAPEVIEAVNVSAFENLLAALAAIRPREPIRMLTIGSAAELGRLGAARLPVTEDAACQPDSDYGRSKWRVTQRVLSGDVPRGIEAIVARTFNLAGPGLDRRLALGSFAEQLAAIAPGASGEIRCGRLDTRRDYLDVRDAVAAYSLLIERGRPGAVYNVCSGRSHALSDLLDAMVQAAGVQAVIRADRSDGRVGDLADVYGSCARLEAATGWRPTVPLAASLADMIEATRACRVNE